MAPFGKLEQNGESMFSPEEPNIGSLFGLEEPNISFKELNIFLMFGTLGPNKEPMFGSSGPKIYI